MAAQVSIPVVYWRPACGFCSNLISALEQAAVSFERVNIWDDPEGAAFVRSVANGSETVPTVVIDGVAHVNPAPRYVIDAVG